MAGNPMRIDDFGHVSWRIRTAMRNARSAAGVATIIGGALLVLAWYTLSPRLAISQLSDWYAEPEELIELYDREKLRAAFERQMLPQVKTYPPPITQQVILDAMSAPTAVRAFVVEPYGEWQFAAVRGLPDELVPEDEGGSMPRVMEITESWDFARTGFNELVATPSDREDQTGNSYRFERDGLRWRLVAIELTTKIR